MRFSAPVTALGCLAVLALGGCTGSEPEPSPEPPAPVLVPGAPGEQARLTTVPGQGAERQDAATEADIRYVTMMIPHHEQALTMTELVAQRATDQRVHALAGRIADAQQGEIAMMRDWLSRHDAQGGHGAHGEHGAHAHELMPGMATPEQLNALRAASGAEFDRLFLDLMIAHHEGALTMAEQELADGIQTRAIEMAQDVIAGQMAEIERMRAMRQ
ncbi:Uncharacterized conserved protein, DUF305 family [Amycolatopsis marina]|uniref:Uncharacterized conserved protein, DUF305 family n=1 Tax=Amycolatopsis marina TaxID=490629 RepID=A0A1I0ZPH6_9PSEU|nr:DUF305 domain-containing protein [Amycolatopsis marina]SFB26350.1 Uncharacterized conserved protein, DUF305 family [Amycolatopsis marina]